MVSVISTAALLGSFMALFLATFLFLVPSRARLANTLLALFLVATAIDISAWSISGWWRANPGISNFRPVLSALQMPLFTGFIWHGCVQDARLRPRDVLHLVPAVLVASFVLSGTPMPWLGALLELQYLAYIVAAILILWRFERRVRTRFAGRSPNLRWMALLVLSSLIAHSIYVARLFFAPELPAEFTTLLQSLTALIILAITLWIAFEALLNPGRFRGGDKLLASAAKAIDPDAAFEHDRLARFMGEQRPYLDPDLSLERLARRSGIAPKTLSALINQRQGTHFFDFINRFRIEHAKGLLSDSNQTVTDILYASGFNSKSTFNIAFRKHAGTTPSAYRQKSKGK